MDVTVCVPTFGGENWIEVAQRAIASAEDQGVPVVHRHGVCLADARNYCAEVVETEWIIYLDADDELAPGYVEAMAAADADLRVPLVQYVQPGGGARRPSMPRVSGHRHTCTPDCLLEGNWLVVGTAVRAAMARKIGWRTFYVFEDYDFWVRCWQAGASIEAVPGATYIAHVRRDSRNRRDTVEARNEVHRMIARANGLPVPA